MSPLLLLLLAHHHLWAGAEPNQRDTEMPSLPWVTEDVATVWSGASVVTL